MKGIDKIASAIGGTVPVLGMEECRQSAVLALFFYDNDELSLLFEKRSPHVSQPGEVSFPGGGMDPGESVEDTALRETDEELRLSSREITMLGEIGLVYSPLGAVVHGCVGTAGVLDIAQLSPDPGEVDRVFSVPFQWFMNNAPEEYRVLLTAHSEIEYDDGRRELLLPVDKLGLPETYRNSWGRGTVPVPVYRFGSEIIWGITARFVKHLVAVLRKEETWVGLEK